MDLEKIKAYYQRYKYQAYCIDVEWTGKYGDITVVGLFRPKNGPVDGYISLVKDKDLSAENLRKILVDAKFIITFNGTSSDLPSLDREFPGCVPEVPHLDLYEVARELNKGFSLLTLEHHYGIYRRREVEDKKRIASKLWRKYMRKKNPEFLNQLLLYNREDTINLYVLAENLMKEIKSP